MNGQPGQCPRCNSDWLNVTWFVLRCKCGLEYFKHLAHFYFYTKRVVIRWYPTSGYSTVATCTGSTYSGQVRLPLLPFTVTEDDLFKYMMLI